MSVDVKICGVCRSEDATVAARAGARYLGVILAPGRARSQTLDRAAAIFAAGRTARRVGVFVDPAPKTVRAAAERLRLDVVQLHGAEPPEAVSRLRDTGLVRVWKAIRPRGRDEFLRLVDAYGPVVDALLLDGWSARDVGGTGTRFPWAEIAAVRSALPDSHRLVAAGGLDPDNVAEAISRLAPDVVDVSSGVERAVGEKDPERIRAFIRAASTAGAAAMRGSRIAREES